MGAVLRSPTSLRPRYPLPDFLAGLRAGAADAFLMSSLFASLLNRAATRAVA